MSRGFWIPGEGMVSVKGGAHMSGVPIGQLSQLGLANGPVQVTPTLFTQDVKCDDMGPQAAAEVVQYLAEVQIDMTLINFDPVVLDVCVDEALAGGGVFANPGSSQNFLAGIMPPAGTPLGNGRNLLSSGNHWISLNIAAPTGFSQGAQFMSGLEVGLPWHFPSATLARDPAVYPLGTRAQVVKLSWRAITYRPLPAVDSDVFEVFSSGAVLWDHNPDTEPEPGGEIAAI